MKKILSTLVMVLFGVSVSFAQNTITANAYVWGEGISEKIPEGETERPRGGGKVKVTPIQWNGTANTGSYKEGTPKEGIAVTVTAKEVNAWGLTGSKKQGAQFKLEATPDDGYYFLNWSKEDTIPATANRWSTANPYTYKHTYGAEPTTRDFYAIFRALTLSNAFNLDTIYSLNADGTIKKTARNLLYTKDVGGVGTKKIKFKTAIQARSLNDFGWELDPTYATEGWQILDVEFKDINVGGDTLIFTIQYTDQNKDNVNTGWNSYARINVWSIAKPETKRYGNIYAMSDLKPNFTTIPEGTYDFTPIEPLAEGESRVLEVQTTKSTIASQNARSWAVSLSSEAASKGYTLLTAATEPNAKVRFTALPGVNQADLTDTLSIICTYRDARNKDIRDTVKIALTADAGKVITIDGKENATVTFDIDYSLTEQTFSKSAEFLTTLNNITTTETNFPAGDFITWDWTEGDTEVGVSVKNILTPGQHKPVLTFASSGVTAALNIVANIRLAQPVVTYTADVGQSVDLSWQPVDGATGYVVKSGATILTTIDNPATTTFRVNAINNAVLCIGEGYPFTVVALYNTLDNFASRESEEIIAIPTIQSTITLNNLPLLYTGTEIFVEEDNPDIKTDDDYTGFPYYQKRQIDLTPAFASMGVPLFNRLYVFGLTTSEEALRYEGINGHKITKATSTAGSNAITPCYIYEKTADGYALVHTVPNMNMSDKDSKFNITADGKYYFTGYCPFATTGYSSAYGVVSVTGNANQVVDIYLHDLCIFARTHTRLGNTSSSDENDLIKVNIDVTDVNYPAASAAVFAFRTSNKNTSTPFQPTIHLLGKNELEGANGYILADVASVRSAKVTLYSAPIHIVATKDIPCTTLSIDDKWLEDENGKEFRTNGCLDVIPDAFGRPSIDLGNEKSTLNINGGQLFVRNAYPESPNYISTLAIGYREYLKVEDVMILGKVRVKLSGAGNDQSGGNVNFNDGTITCDSLTAEIMQEYGAHYRTPISMKCPVNTKINGGSFNCDVWACEGVVVNQDTGIPEGSSIGASPTNSVGDVLAALKVPVISKAEAPYYLAKINFAQHPGELINNVVGDANEGETLNDYYSRISKTYGHSSMKAVAATNVGEHDSVNLMLPYQYTGKQVYSDAYAHGWAYTIPHLKVTGGVELDFGGPTSVKSDENNTTDYIFYGVLDEYITKIESYTTPETYLGQVDVNLEFDKEGNRPIFVEDVINAEEYQIEKAQYIIQSVRGDEWVLFSPPFDVTNVYVLEAYPETDLEDLATTNRNRAYELQAESNMDFFFQYCLRIVDMNTTDDFHSIYNVWKRDVSKFEKGAGLIKLEHFTGRNYHANYYLQRSSGVWEWDAANQKFTTDWKYLPADTVNDSYYHSDHTEHNVIMKKGEIYSLKFPYMYYGYQKEGKWDYWTGKYVIFEGLGTQTIEGKNYHETIRTIETASGKAAVLGNSTLATMTPSVNGYHLERETKNGSQKFYGPYGEEDTEEISIEPTSGFVMVNSTLKAMPGRKASIDMMTGDVTYEPVDGSENTVTGTPTIAGEREMLVYTVAGGLGVVPVVPQHVSIYNAAGQLVVSQYLTDNTQFALPTGIYLVRGEKDQAKAMVK